MTPISSLSDACQELLLDTSVIINLNATGHAERILAALPVRVLVPGPVIRELEMGAQSGYQDAAGLRTLLDGGIVRELALSDAARSEFITLTAGTAESTLGDGEAATIACAYASSAWAAVDDRKAQRISQERYRTVPVVCTVDMLAHHLVVGAFSQSEMDKAILDALMGANMHVPPHYMDWVVDRIEPSMLHRCMSLPRDVRERHIEGH